MNDHILTLAQELYLADHLHQYATILVKNDKLEKIMPLEDWLIAYQELQALRDWKAKAKPLLKDFRLLVINHDDKEYYKRRIATLTELLEE